MQGTETKKMKKIGRIFRLNFNLLKKLYDMIFRSLQLFLKSLQWNYEILDIGQACHTLNLGILTKSEPG